FSINYQRVFLPHVVVRAALGLDVGGIDWCKDASYNHSDQEVSLVPVGLCALGYELGDEFRYGVSAGAYFHLDANDTCRGPLFDIHELVLFSGDFSATIFPKSGGIVYRLSLSVCSNFVRYKFIPGFAIGWAF